MSQQAFVTQRVPLPPSTFSGEEYTYLQRLALAVNNIPRVSFTSFMPTPESNVTGKPGDILVNIASAATAERFFVKNTGSSNTGWISVTTSGSGGGLVNSVSGTTQRIDVVPTTGATVVNISPTYVGQNTITTLGTVTVGSFPAANLTGTTLASGVTGSSLTSVGTLAALTVTATITGSVSGSAATVTGASQTAITSAANLTTVGALISGSIVSGFGSINIGTNTVTSGAITATATTPLTATGAGDIDGLRITSTTTLRPGIRLSNVTTGLLVDLFADNNGGFTIAVNAANTNAVGFTSTGAATFASTLTTADPGSGAGAWKLGKKITGSGLGIVTNNYVEVMIDGSLVKLAEAA